MEFSRQDYWSRLPFPSPRNLPDPRIKPRSLTLQADSLPTDPPGKSSILGIRTKKSGSVQFSSVDQSCPTPCDPMDCSTPGLPVHHQLPEFTQTHVHWIGDAIQQSHPLLSASSVFNLLQHQGLFQWVSSLHQVAKILEFQLQHQSFQWLFRTDFL